MPLERVAASLLCALFISCSTTRQLAPANPEELTRYVLLIRELPDGTVTHSWKPAEEMDLSQYRFLASTRGSARPIVPVMAGRQRDCDKENDECIDKCMSHPLAPGYGHITSNRKKGGKAAYCREQCWQAYRDCLEVEKLRPQEFTAIDFATDWLKRHHKTILVGSVITIAGVAFVVVSAGAGLVILAPVVILANPSEMHEPFMAGVSP
ncbi:hypothetical protein [Hyalangium minutum]|uniref:hypothetical protein n=1 Tax=Hyalangium minutum TaxID=394096 RepID=UPI0005C73779|nr:hypothetical protein [Hyalangium minutum]